MATTTTDTYDISSGVREELADVIYNVSPEDTPFFSNAAKMDVDNSLFEWQTDSLAAVDANVAVEGANATRTADSDTTRLTNYTEILEKTASVSGTAEAVDRAGRDKEMTYQMVKKAKELRRNAEHHMIGVDPNPKAAGNASTARETASLQTWMVTNTSRAGGAGDNPTGDGTDAPTDGTQRAFTEALLGEVLDSCFVEGGNPDVIMANTFNKRALNGFSGNSDSKDLDIGGKRLINAVSVYESDYGIMSVIPNRWLRARDVLVLEMDYWKVAMLRPLQSYELAKMGDSEARQVVMEYGLCAANEASSGIVADLTTS